MFTGIETSGIQVKNFCQLPGKTFFNKFSVFPSAIMQPITKTFLTLALYHLLLLTYYCKPS